jgi:hypothetical protein
MRSEESKNRGTLREGRQKPHEGKSVARAGFQKEHGLTITATCIEEVNKKIQSGDERRAFALRGVGMAFALNPDA